MTAGSARRIGFLASEPHFADHLAAVWKALPEEARGPFISGDSAVLPVLESHGIAPGAPWSGPILTAAVGDLSKALKWSRRLAIMEHGAGQTYGGHYWSKRSSSFAGGDNRETASLFLHPNTAAAERERARYPKARVEVIGAPFLDLIPPVASRPGSRIAFTWHFDSPLCAETRSAFGTFREAVMAIAARREVIGHSHPRFAKDLVPWYGKVGIPTGDVWQVLRDASVLVADNTSLLFAFAATGRPVVVCNAPGYRRELNHGLRFWDAVGGPDGTGPARLGPMVDHPDALADAIDEALADPPEAQAARELAVDMAYTFRTGAAARAAGILQDWAAS